MSRGIAAAVLALAVAACMEAACTLLVSTDGLTGGGSEGGARDAEADSLLADSRGHAESGSGMDAEPGMDGSTDTPIDRPTMADAGPTDAGPPPAIQCVQFTANSASDASAVTATLGAGVAAHDTIVVGVDFSSTVSSITFADDVGSSYQLLVGPIGQYQYLAAAFDAGAGAKAITVRTANGATASFELYVHEYAGLVAFDDGRGAVGSTASMTSGPLTASQGNELVFGYAVAVRGNAAAGSGFTTLSTFDSNLTEQLIAVTPGQYQAMATMTSGTSWSMIGAAFRGQ